MRVPIRFVLLGFVLAEIAAFALAGQVVGVLGTLALTLASTFAGILLLRRQGMAALMRLRAEVSAGRAPTGALAETTILGVAAMLMVVPGLITSAAGLLLFIPPVRRVALRAIGRRIRAGAPRHDAFRPARAQLELSEGEYRVAPRSDTPWQPPEPGPSRGA